jgi:hypothetical protein
MRKAHERNAADPGDYSITTMARQSRRALPNRGTPAVLPIEFGRGGRKIAMTRRQLTFALSVVALVTLAASAGASAQWTVKQDPGTGKCVLESERKTLSDGYQETTLFLTVDGESVTAESKSVLDPGFPDNGLTVDANDFIPIDAVEKRNVAVFRKEYRKIVEQFVRGREVVVTLRFWPTWPATRAHSAAFSLRGFTVAHKQMSECRK